MKKIAKRILAMLLLAALAWTDLPARAEPAGSFALTVINDGAYIAEPQRITYEEGDTVRDALKNSGHSFEGIDEGFIHTIDGVVVSIGYFYDGNEYDLDVPASTIQKGMVFNSLTEGVYCEEYLDLLVALADWGELPEEEAKFPAVKRAYQNAWDGLPVARADRAVTLWNGVAAARAAYADWAAETPVNVSFDVTQGGAPTSDYEAVVFDENDETILPEDGVFALRSGDYSFCITQGSYEVTGDFSVTAGAGSMSIAAELPNEQWYQNVAFYLGGTAATKTEAETVKLAEDRYTVVMPDNLITLYPYIEPAGAAAADPAAIRWYSTHVQYGTDGSVTDYGDESVTSNKKTWSSKNAALSQIVGYGLDGRTLKLKVVNPLANGQVQREYIEVTIERAPLLKSLAVEEPSGTKIGLYSEGQLVNFSYDVKEYDVSTVADSLVITAGTFARVGSRIYGTYEEGYQISVNGEAEPEDGSVTVPVADGDAIQVVVAAPDGRTDSYILHVTKLDSVQVVLTKDNASVTTSLMSEAGSIFLPVEETATRAVFSVIPGSYYWIGTVDEYYHTRNETLMTVGASGASATVTTPVVEQLVTRLSIANNASTNPASMMLPEADFAWNTHSYLVPVLDSLTAFTVRFQLKNTTVSYTRGEYVKNLSTGETTDVQASQTVTGNGALQNLASPAFLTSGGSNNARTDMVWYVTNGVRFYQDYCFATTRVPQINGLTAYDAEGIMQKLSQTANPSKTFDARVMEYDVTVPRGSQSLTFSAEFNNLLKAGEGVYTLTVGEETLERTRTADGYGLVKETLTVSAPLDPEQESETITLRMDTGSEENQINDYVLHVTKSPPVLVSFDLEPADAVVRVEANSTGKSVFADENGIFTLMSGASYCVTVTAHGYIGQELGSFSVSEDQTVAITLEAAPENTSINTEIQADWPRFRNDMNNNGVIDYPTPVDPEKTTLYWAVKGGEGYGSSATGCPIIIGDYIYTYYQTYLIRIDRMTGQIDRDHIGQMVASSNFAINSPTYAEGMVFVGLSNGRVQAFNAETMESLWVYQDPAGGQPNCPISYYDGYIYTGFWLGEATGANFVCISVTDEDPTQTTERKLATWRVYDRGFYWAGSYVGPGAGSGERTYVVVGTDDGTGGTNGYGNLLSIDPKTGEVIDKYESIAKGDIRSSIAYDNGKYYFTSKGGYFCQIALNEDGTFNRASLKKLQLQNGNPSSTASSVSTPCILNGRAYIGVGGTGAFSAYSGHNITVIDLATFTIAYRVLTSGNPQTSALVTTAYAVEDGYNYIYFVDNQTPGPIRVIRDKPGAVSTDFVTTEEGVEVGRVLFTPFGDQAQYAICSPVADSDGFIYFKNDSAYMMMIGPTIDSLEVTAPPEKVMYDVDECFDPTGLEVVAHFSNGVVKDVTQYITFDSDPFTEDMAGEYALDLELDFGSSMLNYQNRGGQAGQEYIFPTTFVNIDIRSPEEALNALKDEAKTELENYKDPEDYREAEAEQLAQIVEAGMAAIDAAEDEEAVAAALADAKALADALKTDEQYRQEEAQQELAAVKETAKAELQNYKDPADYREAEAEQLAQIVASGLELIDAAESVEEVESILASKKAEADSLMTDAQYQALESGVMRIYGSSRYKTSLGIAERVRELMGVEKFSSIILTVGTNFADATSGAYLSIQKGAPILMLNPDNAGSRTLVFNYVKEHLAEDGVVYVLGGELAISESWLAELADFNCVRLAGNTRYATNIAILQEAGVTGGEILVATGLDFPDSLSASAVNIPILLVDGKGGTLKQAQIEFLESLTEPATFTILGGELAVSPEFETALAQYGSVNAERISGASRYQTSVMIARQYFSAPENALLARADEFPDGLCGGILAHLMNAPMILTQAGKQKAAREYALEANLSTGTVLGGSGYITDEVVRNILHLPAEVPIAVRQYQ